MNDKVTDTIRYVGVDDTDLRLFENQYPVEKGISYNSYIVEGSDSIALFDTVDNRRLDQWNELVDGALSGRQPDYLIVLHMEPDHSAGIARTLKKYPQMKVVASQMALKMLPQFFEGIDLEGRTVAVKEGSQIDLGGRTLTFHTASMVHWPEVIVAYDDKERVLFSADAFGRFGSLCYGEESWADEARRYYTNIVGKYGPQVRNLLAKFDGVKVDIIAPLHGPVLRGDLSEYLRLYRLWSGYEPELPDGVLVAYASVYGGTQEAALAVADIIRQRGDREVAVIDLCRQDVSEAVAQAFRMGRMVLASVTYDASVFPAMQAFIHHIASKGLCRRKVALLENGTWAPIAAKVMATMLGEMKQMEIVGQPVTIRSRMHSTDMPALKALADAVCA